MDDDKINEALRYYHGVIAELQESYRKAAEPYVKKIIEIESMRPRRMLIDAETYQRIMDAALDTKP